MCVTHAHVHNHIIIFTHPLSLSPSLSFSLSLSLSLTHTHIGASLFTYGKLGRNVYLCVAVKMKIIIFEINNSKSRYEKKKEVSIHSHALSLQMFNEKLCVGYQSGFSLIHVYADERPQSESV